MGKTSQKEPQHHSRRKIQPTYKPTKTTNIYEKKYKIYIQKFSELKMLKPST